MNSTYKLDVPKTSQKQPLLICVSPNRQTDAAELYIIQIKHIDTNHNNVHLY